jgi:hypothetical protein
LIVRFAHSLFFLLDWFCILTPKRSFKRSMHTCGIRIIWYDMISFSDLSNLTQQKSFKRSTSAREITIFLFITRAREADVSFSFTQGILPFWPYMQRFSLLFGPICLYFLKEWPKFLKKLNIFRTFFEHLVQKCDILAHFDRIWSAFQGKMTVFPN